MQTDTTASSSLLSAEDVVSTEEISPTNRSHSSSYLDINKATRMPHVVSDYHLLSGYRAPLSIASFSTVDEEDSFLNLLNETSHRWRDSAKVPEVEDDHAKKIILEQQEEILRLQAQLQMLQSSSDPNLAPAEPEAIDCAPVEQIEIDHESVESGLTHGLHAPSLMEGDSVLEQSLLDQAPGADISVATGRQKRRHRRTRSTPIVTSHHRTNSLDLILEALS